MIPRSLQKNIKTKMQSLTDARQKLQTQAQQILLASKRVIFSLHRESVEEAKKGWKKTKALLAQAERLVRQEPRLQEEASWRAAQEEFAEATLFLFFVEKKTLPPTSELPNDPEILLGAISDLTGELVRRAVRLAGQGSVKEIPKLYEDIDAVVAFFLSMDLTGSLRAKVDQAKQNLRKMEEIRYDLSLKARMKSASPYVE